MEVLAAEFSLKACPRPSPPAIAGADVEEHSAVVSLDAPEVGAGQVGTADENDLAAGLPEARPVYAQPSLGDSSQPLKQLAGFWSRV